MKIIAEIGSNCRTFAEALHSIDAAKRCGANIVKFQLIEPGDLHPDSKKQILDKAWINSIADYCVKSEIEFMCSVFSASNYRFMNQFVQRHKIASCEVTDIEILDTVNSFKKPVLISTGCIDPIELRDYVLPRLKQCDVTIMFCVSEYPAKIVDYRHLIELKEICGNNYSYGYSDHTIEALLGGTYGLSYIEKHTNFIPGLISDDSPHSLNEREFKLLVRSLRGEYISLAETKCFNVRDNHLRRPIATHDIKQGEQIKLGDNAKYYRCADHAGFALDITKNYKAKSFLKKGSLINYSNVEPE